MTAGADVSSEVERLRERFLSEGLLDDDTLRTDVLDSWRRSQLLRVHPDRLELPFVREPNTESRLCHAAAHVLERIAEDLATPAISVILTSADGVVLDRQASDTTLIWALDEVTLAPGYSYAEEFAGTNGIGTALETGRPTFIRGGEHFVGPLTGLACAGAPVRDPGTGRLVGVLDITSRVDQADPLMLALAKSTASQIEDRMTALAHESETALVQTYLRQTRRFPLGVLAIGGEVVLMNRYLRQALDANDQVALLEHASDLLTAATRRPVQALLPSGATAKIAAFDRISIRSGAISMVFHVHLAAASTAHDLAFHQRAPAHIPGLAGRSSSWRRSCQQVERYCRAREWVVLDGEKGSGRAKLALAVGQYVRPDKTIRVLRSESFATAEEFVTEVAAETAWDDFAVVLADVDSVDEQALEPIASVLQSRVGSGWIAVTKSSASQSPIIETMLLPLFTGTVIVPALRHRIEDLEELVPFLLREITHDNDVRLASDAMRQLAKLPWPGNVAQLRRVLVETVARQRSGVITAAELPYECRSVTRRTLTQMEALERDAIVRSLQENGGNKLEAAQALGMSRATIYRKIKDYGIA
jgi:transcriptional regulator of acetoin/glycerol metabolism